MEVPAPHQPAEDEHEEQWWLLLIVYTRDWIHYGAMAFYFLLAFAAAVRGLLSR